MGYYKNNSGDLLKVAGSSLYVDNPIGTILAFGGSEIPVGWHLCDGTAVSRTAYAELFSVIGTNFGVGDGSTTFNLPDLQGEFLRGAGTNSHTDQGNGANVGVHQDATEIPRIKETSSGLYGFYVSGEENDYKNIDSVISVATNINNHSASASGTSTDVSATFTSRPTNTSVNYIIKCKPVAFPSDVLAQIGDALSYSTTEKLTGGRWIDGKPIYQKTLKSTSALTGTSTQIDVSSLNIDTPVNVWGYGVNSENGRTPFTQGAGSDSVCAIEYFGRTAITLLYTSNYRGTRLTNGYEIYIQYTKTTD